MSRFILSVAFVAALFVAVQAQAAYDAPFTQFDPGEWYASVTRDFLSWRAGFTGAKAIDYDPAEVSIEVLFSISKDGALNATNGVLNIWSILPEAFFLDQTSGNAASGDFTLGIYGPAFAEQGIKAPNVLDLGIVLTGSRGSKGVPVLGLQTGMMKEVSLFVEGSWYNLGTGLSSLAGMLGIDIDDQAYLDGVKHNSNNVNTQYDKSLTYVWSNMITDMLGGGGDVGDVTSYGDVSLRFTAALRNQSGVSFIGVVGPDKAPLPEPATMALVGLGLAGLGLARRRK